MNKYVVGFMFSPNGNNVALIRKNKPEWQRGKLNGIGGKIEEGEKPINAMVREFAEETGYKTHSKRWKRYAVMKGNDDDNQEFICHCFAVVDHLSRLRTMDENEPIQTLQIKNIFKMERQMIDNLPWLICLAYDHLDDGRPKFVTINYS